MSLKRRRNIIGTGIAAAVIAMAITAVVSAAPAQQVRPSDLPPEDYKNLREVRSPVAVNAAIADPRVQDVVRTGVLNETNVELLDSQDDVTIMTWGKQDVAGSWQDGYKISLTQGKVIEVLVDRSTNKPTSVNVSPRPDEQREWNFTQNQRRIISDVMNDQRFQKEFAGKTDGVDYYIAVMRDKGIGDKAYITIASPRDNSFLYFAVVDQTTDTVIFAGRDFGGGMT